MRTVTLTRPGWEGHGWDLHGAIHPVRFDDHGVATVPDDDEFRTWVEPHCHKNGVTVTRAPAPEAAPKKATRPKAKEKK
jgi:hypothetical protein